MGQILFDIYMLWLRNSFKFHQYDEKLICMHNLSVAGIKQYEHSLQFQIFIVEQLEIIDSM